MPAGLSLFCAIFFIYCLRCSIVYIVPISCQQSIRCLSTSVAGAIFLYELTGRLLWLSLDVGGVNNIFLILQCSSALCGAMSLHVFRCWLPPYFDGDLVSCSRMHAGSSLSLSYIPVTAPLSLFISCVQ